MIKLKSWYIITQYDTQTEFGNSMLERIVNQNIEKIVYKGSKYDIKPKQFRLYFEDGIKIQLERIFDYIYELKEYIIIDSTFNAGANSREKKEEKENFDDLLNIEYKEYKKCGKKKLLNIGYKECKKCGEMKSLNNFYVDGNTHKQPCKTCFTKLYEKIKKDYDYNTPKFCECCGETKLPENKFYKDGKGNWVGICIKCRKSGLVKPYIKTRKEIMLLIAQSEKENEHGSHD